MPGKLARPPNMRDMLWNYNWRIGYGCIPIVIVSWVIGGAWVMYKRNRYERFFEKCRDPEYKKFVLDHTSLTPDKYVAFIKRMQEEMAVIKEKYPDQ